MSAFRPLQTCRWTLRTSADWGEPEARPTAKARRRGVDSSAEAPPVRRSSKSEGGRRTPPHNSCRRIMIRPTRHVLKTSKQLFLRRHKRLYPLILRSGRRRASRRTRPPAGPHGSPSDAKHRPETAAQPSLRRLRTLACVRLLTMRVW
jgi:hypothetical protein